VQGNVDFYSVYLNGVLVDETEDSFYELSGLAEGTNTIKVVAVDWATNVI
jgi:hypothetical protein